MGEIIRMEGVVKMYDNGRRAINGVNFSVNKCENVCIFGASGSGKTTLMKLIAGIEAPSAGSICVDGQEVHSMGTDTAAGFRNHTFGILPRHHGLMDNLTVWENATLPLAVRKAPAKVRNQPAMEHMKTLGIAHLANAYPPQLSIMELQLASLARALTGEPKIFLVDGINAGLTQKEQEKMNGLLYAAWEFGELTMICLTDKESDNCPCDRRFRLEYRQITED